MGHTFAPISRRNFCRVTAGIGALSLYPTFFSTPARANVSSDYRALVCVQLEGGFDNWAALSPFDDISYQQYALARPALAHGKDALGPTKLHPSNGLQGHQYALHPNLKPLLEPFGLNDLAIIQNIGNLIEPTSAASFLNKSSRLPTSLFSHNSQQAQVLSGKPRPGNTGWGGRIADEVAGSNSRPEFTCISVGEGSIFLSGASVAPFSFNATGVELLLDGASSFFGSANAANLIRSLATQGTVDSLSMDYARVCSRAFHSSETMRGTIAGISDSQLVELDLGGNELADQLRMVAKVIAASGALGMSRQIFHVRLRNWDNHSGGRGGNIEFAKLASALAGFWKLLKRWEIGSNVTTFTISEFGRNLFSNGNGSDHGWGSISLALGGAVDGGRIIGRPPSVGMNTADTILGGRLVPTTSFAQLHAALAEWMGVQEHKLPVVSPTLSNLPSSSQTLPIFLSNK